MAVTLPAPRPFPRPALILALIVGLRGALYLPHLAHAAALRAGGCAAAALDAHGAGALRVVNVEACRESLVPIAAGVAMCAGLAVTVPVVGAVARGWRPQPRWFGVVTYLLALACLSEVVSATVVFGVLDRFEAAHLPDVVRWLFVGLGLVVGVGGYRQLVATSDAFVIDLLGHPAEHAKFMKAAVLFKLTGGVVFLSVTRVLVGG